MKAFKLNNNFHVSYACKILKQNGAELAYGRESEKFPTYLCYNLVARHFFMYPEVTTESEILPISELNTFLEELGYSNKEFKGILKEIDKLDMEAEVSKRAVGKRIDYDKY